MPRSSLTGLYYERSPRSGRTTVRRAPSPPFTTFPATPEKWLTRPERPASHPLSQHKQIVSTTHMPRPQYPVLYYLHPHRYLDPYLGYPPPPGYRYSGRTRGLYPDDQHSDNSSHGRIRLVSESDMADIPPPPAHSVVSNPTPAHPHPQSH